MQIARPRAQEQKKRRPGRKRGNERRAFSLQQKKTGREIEKSDEKSYFKRIQALEKQEAEGNSAEKCAGRLKDIDGADAENAGRFFAAPVVKLAAGCEERSVQKA